MVIQFAANVIFSSACYCLVSIGFLLVYQTRRVFDFSYAAIYSIAPYISLLCYRKGGLSSVVAIFIGICGSTFIAFIFDKVIYRPMRRNRANELVLMLASLGLLILTQNVLSIFFGDEARTPRYWPATKGINLMGAILTAMQATTILCSIALVIIVSLILRLTSFGKAVRAVASDRQLAWTSGVHVDNIVLLTYLLAAILASTSSIFIGIDTDLTPGMGMPALLIAVIVCVIGGMSSVIGVVVASLLIAFGQQAGIWVIGSQWQDAIAFAILLAFLLVRPEGVVGKKLRKAAA